MANRPNPTGPEEPKSPWLVLFIVVLTVMAFLFVQSMLHNHFFDGGQLNRHEATGP
jgi:hypothetical protein